MLTTQIDCLLFHFPPAGSPTGKMAPGQTWSSYMIVLSSLHILMFNEKHYVIATQGKQVSFHQFFFPLK